MRSFRREYDRVKYEVKAPPEYFAPMALPERVRGLGSVWRIHHILKARFFSVTIMTKVERLV